ncbi:MAG: hypothetical protein V2I43_16025, partial [Parvularcula sp.]|nr:hypothetical protein [Parvularcula sp.]
MMASKPANQDYRREEECLVLDASSPQGRDHLKAMGIEGSALVDALLRAAVEKAKKDEFDPPAAGGYDMYRYATRYMRIALAAEGWALSDRNNVASAIHPETGISVTVCAGDASTGSPVFQPTTKRPHGEEFCQQVFDQPTLFGDEGEVTGYRTTDSAQSWILLHHCTDGWGSLSVR